MSELNGDDFTMEMWAAEPGVQLLPPSFVPKPGFVYRYGGTRLNSGPIRYAVTRELFNDGREIRTETITYDENGKQIGEPFFGSGFVMMASRSGFD